MRELYHAQKFDVAVQRALDRVRLGMPQHQHRRAPDQDAGLVDAAAVVGGDDTPPRPRYPLTSSGSTVRTVRTRCACKPSPAVSGSA